MLEGEQDGWIAPDWRDQPFDTLKERICEAIRDTDDALGRPPFANPSPPRCRHLAAALVDMLRCVQERSRISSLSGCPEVNMTLPVLCASLTRGSDSRRPCPVLMDLLLQALIFVHALSTYPLQSVLKDAREVLPLSPTTFRLIVVAGGMVLDVMRSFLGLPPTAPSEPKQKPAKQKENAKSKPDASKQKDPFFVDESTIVVSIELLKVMFDVVLPPDCMKLLLSLFNKTIKFQRMVGNDGELAARVLGVYGDHLLPCLRPSSLLHCLDVHVLEIFIDTVQLHGEAMTLLTEPVFMQTPLAEWSSARLRGLISYGAERAVRNEDAFGSLQVCVFLARLAALWEREDMILTIQEEAAVWVAALRAASQMPFLITSHRVSTSQTKSASTSLSADEERKEEERIVWPLAVLAECVRKRHTLVEIDSCFSDTTGSTTIMTIPAADGALIQRLIEFLYTRYSHINTSTTQGASKFSKKNFKKNGKFSTTTTPQIGKLTDALCIALWLAPRDVACHVSWSAVDATAAAASAVLGTTQLPPSDCNGFMDLFSTALWTHHRTHNMNHKVDLNCESENASYSEHLLISQKTGEVLLVATQITRRFECCGHIAHPMTNVVTDPAYWSRVCTVLVNIWLGTSETEPHKKNTFFPYEVLLSESVGYVVGRMDENRLISLCRTLVDAPPSQSLAVADCPSFIKAAATSLLGSASKDDSMKRAVESLETLAIKLQDVVDMNVSKAAEREATHEAQRRAASEEAQRQAEALVLSSAAFEHANQQRRVAAEEKMAEVRRAVADRRAAAERAAFKEAQQREARRQAAVEETAAVAEKIRERRQTVQRERLQRYRARMAADAALASFLDALRLTPSRVMTLMTELRPHMDSMSSDQLLEYIVTGNQSVPDDMRAVDSEVEVSFWESVMRRVERHQGEQQDTVQLSFHRRVSPALDLFHYTTGEDGELPLALPFVSLRAASRLLRGDALAGTDFHDGREALLACQQRGLCEVVEGSCILTPLGFRYHYPFHDPERSMDVQLERRRQEVRKLMAEDGEGIRDRFGDGDEEEKEEEKEEDKEDDAIQFTDEIF